MWAWVDAYLYACVGGLGAWALGVKGGRVSEGGRSWVGAWAWLCVGFDICSCGDAWAGLLNVGWCGRRDSCLLCGWVGVT